MNEPLIERLNIQPDELLVVRFPGYMYRKDVDEWERVPKRLFLSASASWC